MSVETRTVNGNPSFATIGKPYLDYYGGVTRQTSDAEIVRLSIECIDEDICLALATFFQKRDCRYGSGERKPFLLSVSELPKSLRHTIYPLIPIYGYWKDLNKLAQTIENDRDVIVNLLANQLWKNMSEGFSDGNLEKWLPTEGQKDDKSWHAVNRIIAAFNTLLTSPIQLRYRIAANVVKDFKRITKIEVEYTVGKRLMVQTDDERILGLTRQYQHVLDKASKLPIILTKMKRTGYRKWCSFVRGYHNVIEHFKSDENWDLINYSAVPSIAFNRSKKQFEKHDNERFQQFINSVTTGKSRINIARLMPFELLAESPNEIRDEQWKQIAKETRDFYNNVPRDNIFHPENTIHVADVSGSMISSRTKPVPIHVSLSLALLMSEVSDRPFYTFSGKPRKYNPTWKSLTEAQKIVNDNNYDTNFRGLIDRIYDDCMLEADQKDVSPSEVIPGSIYVYTDGGFNQMCHEEPTTAADYILNKFGKFRKVPVIIFWNVAGNVRDFAVNDTYNGIIQLSGFSKDTYSAFTRLRSIDDISPEAFFRKTVLCKRYQPVIDAYNEWVQFLPQLFCIEGARIYSLDCTLRKPGENFKSEAIDILVDITLLFNQIVSPYLGVLQ